MHTAPLTGVVFDFVVQRMSAQVFCSGEAFAASVYLADMAFGEGC